MGNDPVATSNLEAVPNSNVLDGVACPQCHSREPFQITACAIFTVTDDGTTDYRDVEWDDSSVIVCQACGTRGVVADFTAADQ